MTDDPILYAKDLERRYGVSRRTVYSWIVSGLLPEPKRTPTGRRFWVLSEIQLSETPDNGKSRANAGSS